MVILLTLHVRTWAQVLHHRAKWPRRSPAETRRIPSPPPPPPPHSPPHPRTAWEQTRAGSCCRAHGPRSPGPGRKAGSGAGCSWWSHVWLCVIACMNIMKGIINFNTISGAVSGLTCMITIEQCVPENSYKTQHGAYIHTHTYMHMCPNM